mmetsp:Transcript_595/g.1402  ORF Transcript_595/g.1402 Transcript_595/m.1402 type:complete len:593 (-) Transcript_595:139-1917(-)
MTDAELAGKTTETVEDTENPVKEEKGREDRATSSMHFGDSNFEVAEEYGDASWSEVCNACCVHSPEEWGMIALGLFGVVFFLYFFLLGLELLGSGAKVMSGCKAGELFGDNPNPIAGLMVGILATVLLQSSSTTTSIIVSLVGSAIDVDQGIFMVMGANIGTSVTNTIVAMGQMGDGDQLERAFAGATVHDMFNFLSVGVLLPLEVATGYLHALTKAMTKNASPKDDEDWEGPIKKIVSPLGKKIIIANKKVTNGIALNNTLSCDDFYPMHCDPTIDPPTYKSCDGKFGLVGCDKDNNYCPAFFVADATAEDDKVSGGVVFFIGIIIIFTCLLGIVAILQKLLLGMSTRIIYKATDINGYIAIAIGAGITMVVQSSSITTSALTPLVGMGALRLEQMFPLTLGANIGTTLTGILASLVSDSVKSLQVALAHLMFNVTGIVIFYPVPYMRQIPLNLARKLGKATRLWRGFPIVYIAVMFVLFPLFFLGLSALFEKDSKGFKVLGSFLVVIIGLVLTYVVYWCKFKGGDEQCSNCLSTRERKRVAIRDLPDDMEYLKAKMVAIIEHTGLPDDDNKDEKNEKPQSSSQESDEIDA